MASGREVESCARRESDEQAMTAVVEFLSAFVLFLVIVSAFLALSQLKLGSNVPDADRYDQMAIDGLERLTDSPGHVVPHVNGVRDIANSTSDWHLMNATTLLKADHLPGLGDGRGHLDVNRIAALANVTEDRLIHGLGIQEGLAINLTITVVDSSNASRIGLELFADGTPRASATRGSTASRLMHVDLEQVRVTLEVHDAGRMPSSLHISEFMVDPLNGPPEWIELYNPDGFAVNLSGWSLAIPEASAPLGGGGALAGGGLLICTGDGETQYNPFGVPTITLLSSGVLGVGGIDALSSGGDTLALGWTEAGTAYTEEVMIITWDSSWTIASNQSLTYDGGGSPSSVTNWTSMVGGTPGW